LIGHVGVVGVHEDEHALDIDILYSLDVQNRIILLPIIILATRPFAIGPDANLFIVLLLATVVHVVAVLLIINQFRNLCKASIVSLVVGAGAVDVGEVLSQL